MHEVDSDIPYFIITSMHIAIKSKRGSLFTFSNILPLVFAHFRINLKDEEKEKVIGSFHEKALKNIGICKDDDAWTSKVVTCKPPLCR